MPTVEIPPALYEQDRGKRSMPDELLGRFEEQKSSYYTLRTMHPEDELRATYALEGLVKVIRVHNTGMRLKLYGQWPENDGEPPNEGNVMYMNDDGYLADKDAPGTEGYLIDPFIASEGDDQEVGYELREPVLVGLPALIAKY